MAQYDIPFLSEGSAATYSFVTVTAAAGALLGFNPSTRVPENFSSFTYDASGHLTFADGKNLAFNATTGTKIGTATTQKIGFWNHAPTTQPVAIVAPSGGGTQDAESRTAISSILTLLNSIGLMA